MRARALAVVASLLLCGACASGGGRPPVPGPTPRPTPTPVIIPTPTPTPEPDCASTDSFKLDVRRLARVLVDATPGSGFPAQPGRGGNFKPLGPEGSADRIRCERKAAPYSWTLDGAACKGLPCDRGGNCLQNGSNDLQLVVCAPGGLVAVKAANGHGSEITATVP